MEFSHLDARPLLVAIAGPNGAGKTTFFHAHLASTGLRFLCADVLAEQLDLGGYEAAGLASALRQALVARGESFVFETVFSDPVGEKLSFFKDAVAVGYTVVVCFVGLTNAELSEERVAMRVTQGGHDVPSDKLRDRFGRTLTNLVAAIRELPHVLVYDNSDLRTPFRQVAVFEDGRPVQFSDSPPEWFAQVSP